MAVSKGQENIWLTNILWNWTVNQLASYITLKDLAPDYHMLQFWYA